MLFYYLSWFASCTHIWCATIDRFRCRSPACNTVIEIVDGPPSSRKKPLQKICSPQTKHARDHGGSFLEHQTFVSTGNVLTLLLRRPAASASKDVEFVDGAFLFHDGELQISWYIIIIIISQNLSLVSLFLLNFEQLFILL